MNENKLPNGWSEAALSNVCNIATGKVDANHATINGKYTFYTCALEPFRADTYSFEGELIVLPGNGANVGHVAFHKGRLEAYQRTYILYHIAINPRFLYWQLKYKWKHSNEEKQFGSATNYIRMGNFTDYLLPVAPLNEQTCIANKLDEFLAQVDTIKSRVDTIPKIIKRFRQSAMSAAMSGKLTEKWRQEHSLSLSEWKELTLGDVSTVQTGSTPLKSESSYYEGGDIPWLTSTVTGQTIVTSADSFVTNEAVEKCRLKIFQPGTLLVAMYGEGKTRGQVTEIAIEATINQACAAIVVDNENTDRKFIKLCIEVNYVNTRLMAEGGTQPNLNLSKVRMIPVMLPSKKEQSRIVLQVHEFFAMAEQVEQRVKDAQLRINHLTQSILAKAFRGELVAQDPNDEPAEKLLERIKAEKAEVGKLTKAVKKAAN